MALRPFADRLAPLFALLEEQTGVPSLFGDEKVAANTAAPAYIWAPSGGPWDVPNESDDENGARELGRFIFAFDVHCIGAAPRNTTALVPEGADFDVAWSLVENLLTAIQQQQGCVYDVGGIDAQDTTLNTRACDLVVTIGMSFEIRETSLDRAEYVKVTITAVGFDTSNAVNPDDKLTAPGG
jgi:hypothetical protein